MILVEMEVELEVLCCNMIMDKIKKLIPFYSEAFMCRVCKREIGIKATPKILD